MKISIYYEDNTNRMTIEVPDEDCEIMVETDYQQRLEKAADKSSVVRRTAQQIMDEECNRPTYNRHHTERRRHVSLDVYDPMGNKLIGSNDVEASFPEDEYSELYSAIKMLEPKQQEMLRKVFWEGKKHTEIANDEGVSGHTIDGRMYRIIKQLRKILLDKKKFSTKP